jgi:hypothetical protein
MSGCTEPFHINERNGTVWYIATDITMAQEQYERFVEDHTHGAMSEGEEMWEELCRNAELEDQEFPLIIGFYLNEDYADRHECRAVSLGSAIQATPPELIAHYQITQ